MSETIELKDEIAGIVAQFESETHALTDETHRNVTLLLNSKLPELNKLKEHLRDIDTFSERTQSEMQTYMIQSLQLFFETVHIIDPKLEYLQVFQKMYSNIALGFMNDLNSLRAFSTFTHEQKKNMILKTTDLFKG